MMTLAMVMKKGREIGSQIAVIEDAYMMNDL